MNEPELTITWHLPDGQTLVTGGWSRLNLLAHADTYDLDLPQQCCGHA